VEELAGGLGFAEEPLAGLVRLQVGGAGGQDDRLDRHRPIDLGIMGQEDLSHGALADFFEDLEATQLFEGHRRLAPMGVQRSSGTTLVVGPPYQRKALVGCALRSRKWPPWRILVSGSRSVKPPPGSTRVHYAPYFL
jgi:hypothetical protein